jgi:hypothetical protein
MKYRLTVEFEADSDDDANEQAFGTDEHPEWGASEKFSSIHRINLYREDGTVV